MTEVVAGVPAQRTEEEVAAVEPVDRVEPVGPAAPDGATAEGYGATDETSALERVQTAAGDAAGKVQDFAGGAVDKIQEVAGGVAEKVGDAAEQVGAASGRIAAQVVDRLRNNAELAAERGTTTIANEVVEKIAGIAAREVPGVYDLGGDVARVVSAVRERVGLGEGEADQGVSVRLSGSTASIKIVFVIEYGFVVYSVTEKVRAKVIGAVENLLGLEVAAVDIVVDDVHVSEEAPPTGA